jgi:hypothetical protein
MPMPTSWATCELALACDIQAPPLALGERLLRCHGEGEFQDGNRERTLVAPGVR